MFSTIDLIFVIEIYFSKSTLDNVNAEGVSVIVKNYKQILIKQNLNKGKTQLLIYLFIETLRIFIFSIIFRFNGSFTLFRTASL